MKKTRIPDDLIKKLTKTYFPTLERSLLMAGAQKHEILLSFIQAISRTLMEYDGNDANYRMICEAMEENVKAVIYESRYKLANANSYTIDLYCLNEAEKVKAFASKSKKALSETIKDIRLQANLTHEEFNFKTQLNTARVESGRANLQIESISRIAYLFELDFNTIFTEVDTKLKKEYVTVK